MAGYLVSHVAHPSLKLCSQKWLWTLILLPLLSSGMTSVCQHACLCRPRGRTQDCVQLASTPSTELHPWQFQYRFEYPSQSSRTYKEVGAQSQDLDSGSDVELNNSILFPCPWPCLEEGCFFPWTVASSMPILTHLPPSRSKLRHGFMFRPRCWCFPWCQSLLSLTPALGRSLSSVTAPQSPAMPSQEHGDSPPVSQARPSYLLGHPTDMKNQLQWPSP